MRKYAFAVRAVLAVGTALPLSAQIFSPRESYFGPECFLRLKSDVARDDD